MAGFSPTYLSSQRKRFACSGLFQLAAPLAEERLSPAARPKPKSKMERGCHCALLR